MEETRRASQGGVGRRPQLASERRGEGARMLMLLTYLARRAVRARAAELGVIIPPRGPRVRPLYKTLLGMAATLLALICLAGVIVILFGSGWNLPGAKKMQPTFTVAL